MRHVRMASTFETHQSYKICAVIRRSRKLNVCHGILSCDALQHRGETCFSRVQVRATETHDALTRVVQRVGRFEQLGGCLQ